MKYNLGYYLFAILAWAFLSVLCAGMYKFLFWLGEMDFGLQHLDWVSAYVLGLFNAALIMNVVSRMETSMIERGWTPPQR